MSKRAHNTQFPEKIWLKGISYSGPTELYRNADPQPTVVINTFLVRMRKLRMNNNLSEEKICEALYMSANEYQERYSTRRTWITIKGEKIDLNKFYESSNLSAKVSYRVFWSRIQRSLKAQDLDLSTLEDALKLSSQDWKSFYGGGRHRTFTYKGQLYPQYINQQFHSVASFLKTIGRYSEKATIWSRMKNGWALDMALSVPLQVPTKRHGIIYKITRIKTEQVYVGLTLCGLEHRWEFHIRAAQNGAMTKLAQAIREDGPAGFTQEILEDNIPDKERLSQREKYWVDKLEALGETGLNIAAPGNLGGSRGKPLEWEGELFPSIAEASYVLGKRTGLPVHVVEKRIRSQEPLPSRSRKHSQHPDAGSNLFRRWLALKNRYPSSMESGWYDNYDQFKSDVNDSFKPGLVLLRLDDSKPWGPKNWEWASSQKKVEVTHGKNIEIDGVSFPSLKAVADKFGIGVSTLKDRIRRQGLSPEEAVRKPLGATSYRQTGPIKVDGLLFKSKRQAILHISQKYSLTEGQARYRFETGHFS